MTSILVMKRLTVDDERKKRLAQLSEPFAPPEQQTDEFYPNCYNISAGMMFWRFLPRLEEPPPPAEYVHIPLPKSGGMADEATCYLVNFVGRWNTAWEAGPLRTQIFEEEEVPQTMRWLECHPDTDFRLVLDGSRNPHIAYEPIYHLLTLDTLRACGLPALKKGFWPQFGFPWQQRTRNHLPRDLATRMQRGLSAQIWPFLTGGPRSAFSCKEPLVLLSNSLDFWLPYLDKVAQKRLSEFERVAHDRDSIGALDEVPVDMRDSVVRPRKGGDVWFGRDDALDATREMVDEADRQGRLRGLIDAVRAHRVEDDFSPRWSFLKEDFERRLYHKRTKVKVTFVELDDTIPSHGPDAEADGNLLWQDLFTLCDPKERQVLVCLRSGTTRATEIASELGYANHSPVSKALAKIRRRVAKLFDL